MILHFGYGGRLGNQLFVLAYIEGMRRRSERVVSTRLGAALRCLERVPRYLDFSGRLAIYLSKKFLRPLVEDWLVPLRVFSSHMETPDGGIARTRGLVPITYLKGNYQFGSLALNPPPFKLRRAYRECAQRVLKEANGKTPLFVHIRRGDYLTYRVNGQPDPSLPVRYYRSALRALLTRVHDPFFFFLGDEPEWLSPLLGHLPHAEVVRREAPLDLAIMSLCRGGVISNSTFAWWGAFLCQHGQPIIAPRFWLGWRSRKWYPPAIRTAMFDTIDVTVGETAEARI
jgi:hypothetical protein